MEYILIVIWILLFIICIYFIKLFSLLEKQETERKEFLFKRFQEIREKLNYICYCVETPELRKIREKQEADEIKGIFKNAFNKLSEEEKEKMNNNWEQIKKYIEGEIKKSK